MPLKNADKLLIEAAIAANEEPRAPKGGRGLLLSIPGKRPRRLMDLAGNLTPAGTCFRFAKSASASACFEWSFVRPSVEDLLLQAKGARVRATREQCVHEVWGGARAHI